MRSGVYITGCLLLLSGCAHGNLHQSVARSVPLDAVPSAATPAAETTEESVNEISLRSRSSVPLLRAQNPDSPGVAITSSSAGKTAVVSHDAATLALIEKETRSFSPEDRERAVAALKAIPSDSIPAVLQLWKAGLISPLAHPTSPVILAPATAADLPAPKTAANSNGSPVDAGLGQRSPWQSQEIQHADYVANGEDGAGEIQQLGFVEPPQFQQIPRVNSRSVGYSPPLPDSWNSQVATSRSEPAGGSIAGRPSAPTEFDQIPPYNPNSGGLVTPGDWQSANGNFTSPRAASGRVPNSFTANSGRPLVTPSDWQTHVAQKSAGGSSLPPLNFSQTSALPPLTRSPPQESFDGPIIRPLRRAAAPDAAELAKASLPTAGFSDPEPPLDPAALGLRPGQKLPGFESSFPVSQLGTQPRGPATILPSNLNVDPAEPLPGRLLAPSPLQTAGDSLQFLILATEAEVGRLVPGQTPDELQYYIQRQVYLRLLYLMSNQTEQALRPIPNIPAADQEFWTQVVWGVHNYFDLPGIPNHAERAAQTISQFNTAMLRLKERAPLELTHVAFCHAINGYGEFETFSKDEFAPGKRVLVYAEINNFHSELSTEGIYRTRLKSTLQIISADSPQDPVEVKAYPVTEDFCRNHRRDYFHSYVVDIPIRCARGSHVLKLIIEDELSGKVATHAVPFVVR